MLLMKPDCERCQKLLDMANPHVFICSYECTFCADCAEGMNHQCPNCGGELVRRPKQLPKADVTQSEHP